MPLLPNVLHQNLSQIMDPPDPMMHPQDTQQAILNFANAINGYAQFVAPLSNPAFQPLAIQAFQSAMAPLNAPPTAEPSSPSFMDLFPQALLMYATQIGLDMAPAFTGTPPITPLNLDAAWEIGLSGGTADAVAASLATTIHAWFLTGLAVNTASGVTITWL